MNKSNSFVCLDVGEKRIGVAVGDDRVRIAVSYDTLLTDGSEIDRIKEIVDIQDANILVIGYPRNQSGEATAQTEYVVEFTNKLRHLPVEIVFQDESLTSVMAENQLIATAKPYEKADIDSRAAAIILQDYMELNYYG